MKNLSLLSKSSAAALIGALAYSAPIAFAQAPDQVVNEDEIVVTARKRNESVKDIPISITAISAVQIEEAGILSARDIADFTPGLQINGDFGRTGERPVIRGITNARADTPQPIGLFIDGVYIRDGLISAITDNLERVEVLKGPQGALYGRSTYGGVLNYITKKPGDELEGSISATLAEHGQYELSGVVSGPLMEGFSGQIGYKHYEFGGEYDNTNANQGSRDVGSEKSDTIYGALRFNPTDNLDAIVRVFHQKDEDGQFAGQLFDSTFNNSNTNVGDRCNVVRSYFCGEVTTPSSVNIATGAPTGTVGTTVFGTPITTAWDFDAGRDSEINRVSAQFNYGFGNGVEFSYAGGFTEETSRSIVNQSYSQTIIGNSFGSFPSAWVTDDINKRDYSSHEVRLSGDFSETLSWIVGAFVYDEDFTNTDRNIIQADLAFDSKRHDEEQSIFAALDWQANDKLAFGFEAKYAQTEGSSTRNSDPNDISKFDAEPTTIRVTADYKLENGGLIYANYAEGFKTGGINSNIDPDDPVFGSVSAFNPEYATQYEAGYRIASNDGFMDFDFAAFYIDLSDQQLSSVVILNEGTPQQVQTTVVQNVGASEVLGFEATATIRPTDNLLLRGSYSLADSTLLEGTDSTHAGIVGNASLSGYETPRVAENAATVTGRYQFADYGDWESFVRLDGIYASSKYAQVHNVQETGDSFKINARAQMENENFALSVWGKNLGDDDTAAGVFRYVDPGDFRFFARAHVVFLPRGRQFGVTGKYKF